MFLHERLLESILKVWMGEGTFQVDLQLQVGSTWVRRVPTLSGFPSTSFVGPSAVRNPQ